MSDLQEQATEPAGDTISSSEKIRGPLPSSTVDAAALPQLDKSIATALHWASICLFGVFATSVIARILPIEVLNPLWQNKLIESIRGGASFPLEGAVCMLLAATFAPRNALIQKRMQLVRRLAGILSVLFLLFIPWQIYTGFKLLNNRASDEAQALASLQSSARAIAASANEAQFREALGSLPGAPPLPATSLGATLPALKENVLQQITPQIKALETQIEDQNNRRRELFSGIALRDSIICLFYALGFGAFARESLQLSLPNPARSFRRLNKTIGSTLNALRQRSEFEAERSTRKRRSDTDRKRDQSRKRELKQYEAEQRKAQRRRQIEARIRERQRRHQR